jgi:hypothetical protein
MRFLRFLLSLSVHIVLLLIAVDALMTLRYPQPGHALGRALFSSFPTWLGPLSIIKQQIWWSAALALVLVSWILAFVSIRVRPRPLRVKTPEGDSLLLDPGAIINFAHAQIEAHPAVTHHRIKVRQVGGRSVAITARVKVIPLQSLPAIKRELETTIRDGFSQVLGIDKIDDITIILGLDEKNLGRRPGPPGKAEPPVPVPARGSLEQTAEAPELITARQNPEIEG